MLEIIIGFFVFCIILFFYLHIHFHLKTSNDLEIYEIEQASKDKMEEICDLRQPVLFDCDEDTEKITKSTNKSYLLDNYPIFEVKIREANININNVNENGTQDNILLPLPLHIATKLFAEDKNATYFSEGNMDFLLETGAQKNMSYNDEFLRPFLVSNCNYDVLMGSANVATPLRYEINYRNYFLVTQGSIKVKLFPPKSSKYLYPVKDYENLEFRSQVNPWEPQPKFRADFDKVKCLEIVLVPGRFLFIPAYWWYSFKFAENTSVSSFKYRTYMNNIAISPHIFMYALQNQNVERKTAKQIDIKSLNQSQSQNEINADLDANVKKVDTNNTTDISAINNILPDISETQGAFLNSETLDNGTTNIQKID